MSPYCTSLTLTVDLDIVRSPTDEPEFEHVSAVVRLAHKYEVDDLVKNGLEHLKQRFRDDYWVFDLNKHADHPRCISVVNIARLTETPSLLRPALFRCCSMDPHELMKGYVREDGVCERLSENDFTRVLLARTELVRLDALAAIRIFRGPSDGCKNPVNCGECFKGALPGLLHPLQPVRTFSPTSIRLTWDDYARKIQIGGGFCKSCRLEIDMVESDERAEMWKLLPSILDIPEPPRRSYF